MLCYPSCYFPSIFYLLWIFLVFWTWSKWSRNRDQKKKKKHYCQHHRLWLQYSDKWQVRQRAVVGWWISPMAETTQTDSHLCAQCSTEQPSPPIPFVRVLPPLILIHALPSPHLHDKVLDTLRFLPISHPNFTSTLGQQPIVQPIMQELSGASESFHVCWWERTEHQSFRSQGVLMATP